MAVEASGLSMLLDAVGDKLATTAANQQQLQGLAAGGIIPASAAPGPSILQRLIGVGMDGTPYQPPSAGGAAVPQQAASPGAAAATPMGAPSGIAQQAMSFFTDKGLSPVGAAGLVGNLMRESGMRTNAVAPGDGADGSNSVGLAQWNGDRARGLQQYAAANQADPNDLHTQLGYVWHELGTTEKPALAALQAATNPLQAAAAGAGYERPAGWTSQNPTGAKDFGRRLAATIGLGGGGTPSIQMASYAPQGGPASGSTPPALAAMPKATGERPQSAQQDAEAAPATVASVPAAASGVPAGYNPGAPLNGMVSMPQIQALIVNPATRAEGLQLWQSYLTPPKVEGIKAGESIFRNGRFIGQAPSAPMSVEPGRSLIDPNTGKTIAAVPPNLEHTEIGTGLYGDKQFGTFNPRTGQAVPFTAQGQVGDTPVGVGAPGGISPIAGAPAAAVNGDDFLKTLPPQIASQVQAIAEGRLKLPPGGRNSGGLAARLPAFVQQYDPTFDQANAEARYGTREAFAHGDVAKTINAGNTAVQHLGDLSDAAEALNNSVSPTWNKIGQEFGNITGGNVAGKQFANTLNDFTGELVKFYRGTGGSEHDIEAAKSALDPSQSPAQLRAGIAQQAKLISGKVSALQSQWHQGMGPKAQDYPIISTESQKSLDRIASRGSPAAEKPNAQPSATAPSSPPIAGARQASDGHWYVADPARAGKYQRVDP